jgi:hypothetical protein
VARIKKVFSNPFSFLFTRGQKERLLAQYVIREHRRGRPLTEILQDPHVVNHFSPEEIRGLFDEPSIIHAFGEDVIAAQRSKI